MFEESVTPSSARQSTLERPRVWGRAPQAVGRGGSGYPVAHASASRRWRATEGFSTGGPGQPALGRGPLATGGEGLGTRVG